MNPPVRVTDWVSTFGGSAWERVADGQWYLHNFAREQPDLNWDHPEVFKAASKYIKHKDHTVAVAAVIACVRQSKAKKKAGRKFLGALKREKRTNVVCALMLGLGKLGVKDKNTIRIAKGEFRKDWKERHKAATRYFGFVKHKPAFRMLAEVLDEPAPKNPDDPNNPPASYWKERWHDWEKAVPFTRWALSQIVEGESFEATAEAKEWAEKEGRKHGIKW